MNRKTLLGSHYMSTARKRAIEISYNLSLNDVLSQLKSQKIIDDVLHQRILKENKLSKEHPLVTISKYKISDRRIEGAAFNVVTLTQWYAHVNGYPYVRIDPMTINFESVVNVISHGYASRLQILPFKVDGDTIDVATCDLSNLDWVAEIERSQRKKIKLHVASPLQIKTLLNEVYVIQKSFKGLESKQGHNEKKLLREGKLKELDELLDSARQKRFGNNEDSIVQIVNWVLSFAESERASDIHIEPKKGMGHIRFRVDGKLRTVYKLHPDDVQTVIARFKILGDLKIDEKRRPQDGQVRYVLDNDKKIEMRLSTVPCQFGEKLVIRIFDKKVAGRDLDYIGFSEQDKKDWEELINKSHGLILVTGPTGSGKTTTLYTSLNMIATPEVNVCTVEDPIEMTVDDFNQVQVNHRIGLGFSECVRAFLRQDPDVIMVGEIRDQETGMIAIQSSLTGHLVFSTVHTNGALPTIQRLLDLGIPPYLLNTSLLGVLAQRLVRKLCPHCKVKVPTPEDAWHALVEDNDVEMPEHVYEATGCDECKNTGFMGRFCIYELVKMNHVLRKAIRPDIEVEELREATKGTFVPIRVNAAQKVIAGETCIEEVIKVVY